jgi:hypothetical protein
VAKQQARELGSWYARVWYIHVLLKQQQTVAASSGLHGKAIHVNLYPSQQERNFKK